MASWGALQWAVGMTVYVSLWTLVHHCHWRVPPALLIPDPAQPERFCAGKALEHVKALASLGVRNVGSVANEVEAPRYLLSELQKLQAKAVAAGATLEIDRQQASGAFQIDFLTDFTSVYANLTNVVARLSWPESARHAILVSAHFDSAWNSAGASDDLVQVGTSLEFVRSLIAGKPLPVAVVFNFNGGEETILQAAHGFITSHKWAEECRVVINLEAAGVGGRELLFQTGPGNHWLMESYIQAAPYPHSSVIAQELFMSGLVPGETDYRIYRDYGKMPGFDAAFIMDGWAYHSSMDSFPRLNATAGSVQRCGENYLATLRQVALAPELDPAHPNLTHTPSGVWTVDSEDDRAAVFFDVLGLFMVSYSKVVALTMHLGSIALAALIWSTSGSSPKLVATASTCLQAFGAAAVVALTVASGLTLVAPMSWFSRPYLLMLLYAAPCFAAELRVHQSAIGKRALTQHGAFLCGLALSSSMMMALTALGSGAAYLPFLWVIFPMVGWLIAPSDNGVARTTLLLLSYAAPLVVTGGVVLEVVLFFAPILGRGGTAIPPDLVLAAVMCVVTPIFAHPLVVVLVYPCNTHLIVPEVGKSKEALGSKGRVRAPSTSKGSAYLVNALTWAFTCGVAIALISPIYTPERPKRVIVQHTTRKAFDAKGHVVAEDAGLWINAMDYISPFPYLSRAFQAAGQNSTHSIPGFEPMENASAKKSLKAYYPFIRDGKEVDVGSPVYTNNPWVFPIAHMFGNHMYATTAMFEPRFPTQVTLLSNSVLQDPLRRRMKFDITGSDHMVILMEEGAVHWWSLLDTVPKATKGAHFVLYSSGLSSENAYTHTDESRKGNFIMEVEVLGDSAPIRIVLISHEFDFSLSEEVKLVLETMPLWMTDASWASHWRSHTFV